MNKLKALERLEDSLAKLPGVGRKSAERMAFAMLDMDESDIQEFAKALTDFKSSIKICSECGNLCEGEKCSICLDEDRDHSQIMVVSSARDLMTLESSEGYKGVYHVLGGTISISRGKGIEDLNIDSLIEKIDAGNVKEVILATNPTIEGETTAIYISKLLEGKNVEVTRLAQGLPMGGNLEYADALTVFKALENRRKI